MINMNAESKMSGKIRDNLLIYKLYLLYSCLKILKNILIKAMTVIRQKSNSRDFL